MDQSNEPARKKVKLNPNKEKAGKPFRPGSFIKCESNEQKVAAYLGYTDTADLWAFAISWPMLRALTQFEPIAASMRPDAALSLIRDDSKSFAFVNDPTEEWGPKNGDSVPEEARKRDCRLAAILTQIRIDIVTMDFKCPAQNEELHELHRKVWESKNTHRAYDFPNTNLIKYRPVTHEDIKTVITQRRRRLVRVPQLGPHIGKSGLEQWNRCWAVLEYLFQTTQALSLAARFSGESLPRGIKVESHNIPDWMRPIDPATLRYEYFEVSWVHKLDVSRDTVQRCISEAESRGIKKPDQRQQLEVDPRLFQGRELEKQIYEQFRCADLGINIESLFLSYFTTDDDDEDDDGGDEDGLGRHIDTLLPKPVRRTVCVDLNEWSDILEILNAPNNSIFVFEVSFWARHRKGRKSGQ